MRSLQAIFNERAALLGINVPGRDIPDSVFRRLGIPIVVACVRCTAMLPSLGAYVDDSGYTYCAECAGAHSGDDESPA